MKKEELPKVGQRIRYKVRGGTTRVAIVTDIFPGLVFPIEIRAATSVHWCPRTDRRGVKGLIKPDEVIHIVKKGEKDAKV